MKHFVILELGSNTESPMIGVVGNIPNNEQGVESLKERLINALGEHFDSDDVHLLQKFPDMFLNIPYEDLMIEVDNVVYQIRILETWFY